jgi:hypothetical protein
LSFGLGGREIGVKSPISLCCETSSDREFLMNNWRKIAVAQIPPSSIDISHILGKAMEYMRKAYMEGAALGIFPEMYLKRER